MKIILENPFRLLGVYSNSPLREVVANSNKIKAYSRIGKSVDFPTDFQIFLPQVNRNEETVDNAMSKLNQNDDRLLYSLFWFVKKSPIDEIAFGHLCAGNKSKAKEIFEKKQSASSLLNLGIISFIENDIPSGLDYYCKVLQNEDYRNELLDSWFGGGYEFSLDCIFDSFINVLIDELSVSKLLEFCDSIDKELAVTIKQVIVDEVINGIYSQLAIAKNADKNENSQLSAGKSLMAVVQEGLVKLKSCGIAESKLNEIADNAAKQILQCGINYYNKSKKTDKGRDVLPLFEYADKIATSALTKQRTSENLRILKEAIDSYPPVKVEKEAAFLSKKLGAFKLRKSNLDDALSFLGIVFPVLAEIKSTLGNNHLYYKSICTSIESTILSITINEVNKAVENVNKAFGGAIHTSYSDLKYTLTKAWEITLCMDKLTLQPNAVQRYESQRKALYEIMDGVVDKTMINRPYDLITEEEIFRKCNSINAYEMYISKFPDGKFIDDAKKEIDNLKRIENERREELIKKVEKCTLFSEAIKFAIQCSDKKILEIIDDKCFSLCSKKSDFKKYLDCFGRKSKHFDEANILKEGGKVERFLKNYLVLIIICVVVILFVLMVIRKSQKQQQQQLEEQRIETAKFNELASTPSVDLCNYFIKKYPNSEYKDSVLHIYFNLIKNDSLSKVYEYSVALYDTKIGEVAENIIREICDSIYAETEKINTIEAWEKFIAFVPDLKYSKDANGRLDYLRELVWKNESEAWKMAEEMNTVYGYNKYLEYHPKGSHAKIAEERFVDLAVDDVFSNEHGSLPSMDKTGYSYGSTSKVEVENKTSFTLTLLYSGKDKRRLVLAPYQSSSIALRNGEYRIAASVDDASVRSYAGNETLTGGGYSVTYYISTTRY